MLTDSNWEFMYALVISYAIYLDVLNFFYQFVKKNLHAFTFSNKHDVRFNLFQSIFATYEWSVSIIKIN